MVSCCAHWPFGATAIRILMRIYNANPHYGLLLRSLAVWRNCNPHFNADLQRQSALWSFTALIGRLAQLQSAF
jgi:hypothetical protein